MAWIRHSRFSSASTNQASSTLTLAIWLPAFPRDRSLEFLQEDSDVFGIVADEVVAEVQGSDLSGSLVLSQRLHGDAEKLCGFARLQKGRYSQVVLTNMRRINGTLSLQNWMSIDSGCTGFRPMARNRPWTPTKNSGSSGKLGTPLRLPGAPGV